MNETFDQRSNPSEPTAAACHAPGNDAGVVGLGGAGGWRGSAQIAGDVGGRTYTIGRAASWVRCA